MSKAIPEGREGLIPHLVCSPCAEAMAFYEKAFGAVELGRIQMPGDERIMHAEMDIDGKTIFLVDAMPEYCGGKSLAPTALGGSCVTIHRYVEDCDAVIARAVEAGATVQMPVDDMFWGDRYGSVVDPFGHTWSVATHKQDLTPEEMERAMAEAFAQHGQQG
jgi:uncharacterized glyoxalase superfamily protein PhnB